jgi:hypothetical protein
VPRAVDWAYPSRFEHDETGAGEMPVLQRACETVKCLLKNNQWEFLIFRLGRRRSPKWKKPGELPGFLLVRYAIRNRRLQIREVAMPELRMPERHWLKPMRRLDDMLKRPNIVSRICGRPSTAQ